MPIFGSGASPFDNDVEKITNEKNTSEDWGLIMDLCDRVLSARDGPKDCMRAIKKRLNHQDPHVIMQAITLLDACASNCGKPFRLEVASREFEHDYKKLLAKSHPKVQDRLKQMLKKWSEGDFKNDSQLSLIPSLYMQLKRDGVDFNSSEQHPNGYDEWTYNELRRQAAKKQKGRTRAYDKMLNAVPGGKNRNKDKNRHRRHREDYGDYRRDFGRNRDYNQPQRSRSFDSHPSRDGNGYDCDNERQRPRASNNPNVVSSQQEEEDIAKAIQMSLAEDKARSSSSHQSSSAMTGSSQLYPSTSLPANGNSGQTNIGGGGFAMASNNGTDGFKEPQKARALYDFEAAEDNELTFKTGEIVIITDSSDQNWWKGSNHRGEGLFPANFVTTDLEAEPEKKDERRRRSVQFNDSVQVKNLDDELQQQQQQQQQQQREQQQAALGPVQIDEAKIDNVLSLLHDADPTSSETDPPELVPLESHVNEMGPMIDNELEVVDRRLAQLTRLSTELVDALNLYHQLMRDMPATSMYGAAMPPYQQPYMMPQQQQMPPNAYAPPNYSSMPPASVASPQMMAPPTSMASMISGQPDGVMQQQAAPSPNSSQLQLQAMDPSQYAATYSSQMAPPQQQQPQQPQQHQMAPPPQAATSSSSVAPQSYQPAGVASVGMPDQQNIYGAYPPQTQMAPM